MLTNRGVLVLSSIMVFGAFYTYLFYSWFPRYLTAARGLDDLAAGRLASVAISGSAVGVFLGGFVSDRITRVSADPVRARRYLGGGCFLTAAGCLFAGVRCDDPAAVAGLFAAAMCAMHVTVPNWWSMAIPQGGRHVGAVFGLMNGLGVLGAMASQWFVGAFTDRQARLGYAGRAQWDPLFDVYVGALVLGGLAWLSYRPRPLPALPRSVVVDGAGWGGGWSVSSPWRPGWTAPCGIWCALRRRMRHARPAKLQVRYH